MDQQLVEHLMSKLMTLSGLSERSERTNCRCVFNGRTKRGVKICDVPKSKKHRSGTVFAGSCTNPIRK